MRKVQRACASFCGLLKNEVGSQRKSCRGLEGQKSYRALRVPLKGQCGGHRLPISGTHFGDLIRQRHTGIPKE